MQLSSWWLSWGLAVSLMLAGCSGAPGGEDDAGTDAGTDAGAVPTSTIRVTRTQTLSDGATDTIGMISTHFAAPTLVYTIHNDGTADFSLGTGPELVTASDVTNVTGLGVSLTQPASSTVPAGGSVTFSVDYQVAGSGAFGFTLSFTSNADTGQAGATFEIVVAGAGDASTRILAISRAGALADNATDSVGTVDTTEPAPTLTYTLTNNGSGALSFTTAAPYVTVATSPAPVNIAGTPTVSQQPSATVAAGGGTTTFSVDYQVASAGAFSFTLVFSTNATSGQSGGKFELNVSGTGVTPGRSLQVRRAYTTLTEGAQLDLGRRGWGSAGETVDLVLTNPGTDPLTFSGSPDFVTVSNPTNIDGSVTVTQPLSATLAAGATQTVSLDFTVQNQGAFSFTLSIATNATSGQNGGTYDIQVVGTGGYGFTFQKIISGTNNHEPYVSSQVSGGAEVRIVTGGFSGTQTLQSAPVASPNGQYIAYTMQDPNDSSGPRNLFVVPSSGGTAVQVNPGAVSGQRYVLSFAWAPGKGSTQYLLFLGDTENPTSSAYELFTARITGTTPTVSDVTRVDGYGGSTTTLRPGSGFSWNADGTRFGFILTNNTGGSPDQLWGCSFDQSTHTPSTAARIDGAGSFTHTAYKVTELAWAADAIVYRADDTNQGEPRLWATQVSTGGSGVLSATTAALQSANVTSPATVPPQPGWGVSPNGQRIAYVRDGSGTDHVYGVTVDTTTQPTPLQLDSVSGALSTEDGVSAVKWATSDGIVLLADLLDDNVNDPLRDLFWQPLTSATGAIVLVGDAVKLTTLPTDFTAGTFFYLSPEGKRVFYMLSHYQQSSPSRLFVSTLSDTPIEEEVSTGFANANRTFNQLAWRPGDGMGLLFMSDGNTSGETEGCYVPLRGEEGVSPGTRFSFTGTRPAGTGANNGSFIP